MKTVILTNINYQLTGLRFIRELQRVLKCRVILEPPEDDKAPAGVIASGLDLPARSVLVDKLQRSGLTVYPNGEDPESPGRYAWDIFPRPKEPKKRIEIYGYKDLDLFAETLAASGAVVAQELVSSEGEPMQAAEVSGSGFTEKEAYQIAALMLEEPGVYVGDLEFSEPGKLEFKVLQRDPYAWDQF